MGGLASLEDQLNHAFRLAHFVLGDREAAICVAERAVARVEVALLAQDRRLYHRLTNGPEGRKAARFRNRVSYDEVQVLQRQVYVESEPFERQMESSPLATGLDERDLLVFFVKHLVRITIKRNSFYVMLGATRLLRNYTTSEAMEFYTAVIQDPDRLKDDYYFRSRKGVLMKELKERFGDLVRVHRGPHGEERWQTGRHTDGTLALVDECFKHFTPWRTSCPIREGVAPRTTEIDELCSCRDSSEDAVEVRRIHAGIHTDCLRLLSESLGFGDPRERLDVPQFFLSSGDGTPRSRRQTEPLSSDELASMRGFLELQADLRRRAPVAVLRVVVDGVERARLDPYRVRSVSFELDEDVERLDVLGEQDGGDLVLATHFFAHTADGTLRNADLGIRLEAGQKFRLVIGRDVANGPVVATLDYRETNLLRRAYVLAHTLASVLSGFRGTWRVVERPGLAASMSRT